MQRQGEDVECPGRASSRVALFRRLVDHTPALLAYWDARCCNVVANAAYREWFGLDPARVQGMHVRDVLGEDLYARNLPYIRAVLAGQEQHFDRTMTDAAGRARQTQVSYIPDVVDGVTVGFVAMVTDVSARFEAEQAAARAVEQFRAVVRNLPASFVMLFDRDLRYLIADGQGLEAFGLSRGDVEGRTMQEVLADRACELEPRYLAALDGTTSHWSRNVGGRVYSLTAAPVVGDDGEVKAGMVVGMDVTRERRAATSKAALHALSLAAARRAPLEEVADLAASSARELLQADSASVARFDDGEISIVAVRPAALLMVDRLPLDGSSAVGVVAATGASCILDRPQVARAGGPLRGAPPAVGIAAPIRVAGKLWGAVGVGAEDDFEDRAESLHLLEEFADLVSLALTNIEAWGSLDREARVDHLTSLPNRRAFDERLEAEVARAARTGGSLGILVIDLDHFKDINDRYGHQAGDTVLAEAGRRLTSTARGYELVARLGGEEFSVIASGGDDIRAVAERFRRAIGSTPFPGDVTVTASVGAAAGKGRIEPSRLFRQADRALYAAKASGRDRTVVSDSEGFHRH